MLAALLLLVQSAPAPTTYHLLVAAESSDLVHQLAFDGRALVEVTRVEVGYQATEVEGPHGLAVEPGGAHWYVSLSHGKPNGVLHKYRAGTNEPVGSVELGLYPASLTVAGDTGLLYCVNFDLYGTMAPSTVSVVDVEAMAEVARTVTGPMPHGSRLSPDGRRHYSVAMMSDELVELDTTTFEVTRRLTLDDGSGIAARVKQEHGAVTRPTWVQPHPTAPRAYVALNGAHQLVEIDLDAWRVTRRYPTGRGPYNVELTPDGTRAVVTYKGARAVGVIELTTGKELARIETTRRVPHGVVIPPDGRFAFVSCEGVGGEPGAVDALDLASLQRVASCDVGLQAGGLALWKTEPAVPEPGAPTTRAAPTTRDSAKTP